MKRDTGVHRCKVDDDGTADFSPRLITDGKQVCLIWQNMEVVLADDISLKDAVYWSNLNIAVFIERIF